VIEAAGFGDRFVHRTGHSIDRDLHGSGPHLDDYETHDDRRLVPGIGFSVVPRGASDMGRPGRFPASQDPRSADRFCGVSSDNSGARPRWISA